MRLTGLILAALVVSVTSATVAADRGQKPVGIVDMHVHAAGIGAGDSGAYIGDEMRDNFRFPFYLRAFGVTEEELNAKGDGVVIERISTLVAASSRVGKAVVLAMDGVVGADGEFDRQATQFYLPGTFVAEQTALYDNLCYGASVNPYRRDALERLRQARADGAVLLKWLPNIMHIDPADRALADFYRALVELDLPLLSHVGQEKSFATARDELGDPARLTLPLEMGVTVIGAHIGTTGENDGVPNFERILPMFEEYPNLYADISSLTQINKRDYLVRALAVPGLPERLIYGTDWPLLFFPLVSPFWHVPHIGVGTAWRLGRMDNVWDRDVALKEALGTPPAVFARSAELLDMGRCR